MKKASRIIGQYDTKEPGPLFICLGAIHGNEPAGVEAIDIVLTLLQREKIVNPDFLFRGRMIGVTGNIRALQIGKRFIDSDLNRILTAERIQKVLNTNDYELKEEDIEIKELVSTVQQEIANYEATSIVVLDIHTTSAAGGIFVITSGDSESLRIGRELHAPVILDFAHEVSGTTLEFFSRKNFDRNITAVVFECGQHSEALSVNRAMAAIINCMRTIGCINAEDVENKHDLLLKEYSKGLPKVARLIERYGIQEGHAFKLVRDFKNFEFVEAGDIIAHSNDEPIATKHKGLILMPRLQEIGDDGYFIVEPIEY